MRAPCPRCEREVRLKTNGELWRHVKPGSVEACEPVVEAEPEKVPYQLGEFCSSGRHCLIRECEGGVWFLRCTSCPYITAE